MIKVQVSLVIIALNEEAGIARCIESAKWVDEIIVVDSGSQDRTQEIARSLGAQVVQENWRGYREQKVFACSLAKNDWILSLDADEALSPNLSQILRELCSGIAHQSTDQLINFDFAKMDGIEFSRLSFNLGRWIAHGGWFPDWQLRFFHRGRTHWQASHVHERVHAANKIRLKESILHWPFESLSEQIATNNHYSSLGADDLLARGQKFSLAKLFFKPVSKFLETYAIKMGFLDGLAGFIISVGAAYSTFLKYAKLWEKQKREKESSSHSSYHLDAR